MYSGAVSARVHVYIASSSCLSLCCETDLFTRSPQIGHLHRPKDVYHGSLIW
ncbi:hypothetical protein I79_015103 [Cricetulus griseus]|uniref:Uncharacterized protein n=1 Tax=Cricetulus griseus TaxID=10029 RepID=G3HVW1_CRIGR|nr:hypothetical protein I79_015103 [Cricetulus griseus]